MAGMLKDMAQIAGECLRTPRHESVWNPQLERYVCPELDEGAISTQGPPADSTLVKQHSPLGAEFKLVFLTAFVGTLLFAAFCLVLTLLAGEEPRPLLEKTISGFFDLAKIGFGAIVGLLGGKSIQS
jgi:hypothetical protein